MACFGNHDVSPGRNRSLYSSLPMQLYNSASSATKSSNMKHRQGHPLTQLPLLLLVRLTTQPLSRSRSQKTPFPTTVEILRYIVYKCLTPCQEIPRHVDDLTFMYESKTKPRGCWQRRLSFSGSRVFIICPDSGF
ncbi:hypothetical protein D6D12_00665 [Aureobasidium pullulans]|uniref:Uncharacterized protein n=1 Tax=Aureobasidium pullulans TaxID=5580 RepID=A0AB74K703_AURPU|nr:hypothetical protein D6D12_00665 [Aureobasidium pullulans]THX62695.1 hypothetical protein D6D11_02330 [Aureobasidium pullulans]THX93308.1 hypothetical protein D6D08_02132 [Aureobasidium pullulans]